MSLLQNLCKLNLGRLLPAQNLFLRVASVYTSASPLDEEKERGPKRFKSYNEVVYPPQLAGEERRPAFVCHQKENIKYSPFKMHFVAVMVRGLSVDEALRQLAVCVKKGAPYIRDAILEAQEMAVKDHNVEFKSNLWVAESFSGNAMMLKGMRRHAKRRVGRVHYKYCHYFVRLEEGPPPKEYYIHKDTPDEQLEKWLTQMKQRKVLLSM